MADGDVTIKVTLDTKEVKDKIGELTKDLEQMLKSSNGGALTKDLKEIAITLESVTKRVEQVTSAMDKMEANGNTGSSQYQEAQQKLESYANTLAIADARARTGTSNINRYAKKTNSALASIKKSATQAFSFKGLSRGIRRLAQLALGVYSVTAILNKLKSAIKQGINNLVQFQSDTNATNQAMTELKTSLLFIQNAWGAAFAPIINVVQPILTALMDTFAQLGNTIARFFAALTGGEKVIQAIRVSTGDYAKSLKSAGGAAKQLQDRLAAFDDLNVLGKDKDSGGGGVGSSGVDPNDTFEYVDVDKSEFAGILGFFDDLKKKVEDSGLIDAVKNFWDALQNFKDSEFVKTMEKVIGVIANQTFISILGTLTDLFNLMADILNGDLNSGLQDFKELVADLTFDPLITLASVFDTIFGTDVAGWLEEVKQSIEDIDLTELPGYDKLVEALGELETSWNNLKDSVKNFWDMLEETGVLDALTSFLTDFVSLGFDLLLQGVASALSLLADSLQIIADIFAGDFPAVLDDIKNTLADIDFQPLETVASIFDHIFNTDIAGWLEGVHEKIEELHFQDLVDSFVEGWENIKSAFWLGVGIIAAVLGLTDEKVQKFSAAIRLVITALSLFLKVTWGEIQKFTTSYFEALATVVRYIWNKIIEYIRTPVNTVISIMNIFIGGIEKLINGIADALGSLSFDIPNWVPEWGGKSIKFDIKHVSLGRIPHLAEGAVIPPNKEFMAVLGDQSSGTNIEAPLDTIKQAVAEELSAQIEVLTNGFQSVVNAINNKDLNIGDKEIGQANARYKAQQQIIRGTSF